MEFKTQAHKAIFERVAGLLKEMFGEMVQQRPDRTVFWIQFGSCIVNIGVNQWGDEDATVIVYCYVVTGADLRQDLLLHLLKKNDTTRFGAFSVDEYNNVCFQQTIIGSTVDKTQLKATVMAVAYTSDNSDDEIVSRWGGQRAMDR